MHAHEQTANKPGTTFDTAASGDYHHCMRIALDARLTNYSSGGISEYIRQLSGRLPALDSHNDYLILQSHKAAEPLDHLSGIRLVKCFTPAHHPLERTTLTLELLPWRAHLLHSPDFIAPRGGPWRSVITIHDLTFLRYPNFLNPKSRQYYNHQIHSSVKRADAILADSNATRSDILELLGVHPEKVTTVHLAADERFHPQPEEMITSTRNRLDLPRHYLLFVGTFEPRKNIPSLLHAYADLRSQHSGAPPLLLVGKPGWLFDSTDRLLDELGLRGSVLCRSNISPQDLPALYTGALALILPSHYEGFGLPVLEAMSCGTPTIISTRASLPEIAGDAALTCEPDKPESITDAISLVLFDSELRANLSRRGLQRASQFTWKTCCSKTLEVYHRVLNQS